MPSIKLKKKTQEYLAEKEREKEKEAAEAQQAEQKKTTEKQASKKKTPALLSKLDGEVLTEKRKRTVPVAEQRCADWVVDNFEHKDDSVVRLPLMYQYYTETALEGQGVAVDVPVFNRIVKEKLGEQFGVKESSPLKGIVKEKKPTDKKPKEAKAKGENQGVKIKDTVVEIITAAGNPLKGLTFVTLKKKVGEAVPSLQLELYPGKLLQTLDRGVRFGQITLVRGTGKCGLYRVPGESTAEEDKPKPKKEKAKKEQKSENGEESSEAAEGGAEEGDKGGEDLPVKKRGKKRKSAEVEEDAEKKAEGGESEKEGEQAASPKKKKKKAAKKHKREFYEYSGQAEKHAEPRRIEDVFPMAITFMGDPKEASLSKIKHYIQTYYPEVDCEAKLRKALDKGEGSGLWQRVGGSYNILQTDFNPSYSTNIEDMITQAIMATHAPKIASSFYMKKYIMQYHPEFNIENRPHLYKAAIERGIKKGIIRQVSGIGSSGSFQLVNSFNPSPAILAGEVEDERSYLQQENLPQDEGDKYAEVYIVRKTKSGRFGGQKPWSSNTVSSSSSRRRR